jgi:AraC-like DNA-binding protein
MRAPCDLHEPAMQRFHPFHSQLYVGPGRALYCGPLQHLEAHVYGAPVLHVGIYRPFKLKLAGGEWRSYRVAVVPPGLRHALDVAGGVHGKLFVEIDGPSASAFRRRFPYRKGAVTPLRDAEAVACFHWIFEENPQQAAVEQRLDRLLPAEDGDGLLDRRIEQIVALIRNEPDRNHSQGELGAVLGLSPSRVLHLFSEQVGVPYRRYRMWKRLWLATERLHASDNMTMAAVESGFADATHYSHAFRDTFGVNPAPVFRKIERFERLV